MGRHPTVVVREVVWRGSMAEYVHEQKAVCAQPGSDFSEQRFVVLHVFKHLLA